MDDAGLQARGQTVQRDGLAFKLRGAVHSRVGDMLVGEADLKIAAVDQDRVFQSAGRDLNRNGGRQVAFEHLADGNADVIVSAAGRRCAEGHQLGPIHVFRRCGSRFFRFSRGFCLLFRGGLFFRCCGGGSCC